MKKYKFELKQCDIPEFREKDHIFPAQSLTDAVTKFTRKHELEAPAYWDEPFFEQSIDLVFKNRYGRVKYQISW